MRKHREKDINPEYSERTHASQCNKRRGIRFAEASEYAAEYVLNTADEVRGGSDCQFLQGEADDHFRRRHGHDQRSGKDHQYSAEACAECSRYQNAADNSLLYAPEVVCSCVLRNIRCDGEGGRIAYVIQYYIKLACDGDSRSSVLAKAVHRGAYKQIHECKYCTVNSGCDADLQNLFECLDFELNPFEMDAGRMLPCCICTGVACRQGFPGRCF